MNHRFCFRSGTLVARFTSDVALRAARVGIAPAVSCMVLVAAAACSSGGSAFATGGSAGTGSTGSSTGTGSGGSSTTGAGGSISQTGSGGSGASTGGSDAPGAGGSSSTTGSGGATGTGGAGPGSGESGGSAGTSTAGSGGSGGAAGSNAGGAAGAGGARPIDAGAPSREAATPPPPQVCPKASGICHEFFANDNSPNNRLNYVNEFVANKAADWGVSVGATGVNSPRSLEIVQNPLGKNGRGVLVSLENGYAEFDPDNKGARLTRVTYGSNITGACRLPDGNTALGNSTNITIITPAGTLVRNLPLQAGANLRTINRNGTTGNYLYTLTVGGDTNGFAFEMSATGAPLWNAPLGAGAKGYTAWWRPAGGIYATTGELGTVVTIDANKQVIGTVNAKTANPKGIDFFSGFVVLPNGNFVVANWLGHASGAALGDVPQILEYTPAGATVWSYGTKAWATQITNVLVVQ